ncbi:PAS domain-containing sensor histidine kinase [candidate division KSB1 bacterium]|nr:PAS domain-containing sensor histidine kinase [candidate division KSB1 bacterium]
MPKQNQNNEQVISDLQQHTSQLSALNSLLSEIINAFPYNVVVIDFDFNILNCNQALKDILGENPVGQNLFKTMPNYDQAQVRNTIHDAISGTDGFIKSLKVKDSTRDMNWVQYHIIRLDKNAGIDAVLIVSKKLEISENLSLDESLQDKFQMLSSFSGKVAHDINNPLSVIMTRMDFLQTQDIESELEEGNIDLKEEITLVQNQAGRIYSIIDNIGALQIHSKEEPKLCNLSEIVNRAVMIVEFQRPYKNVHAQKTIARDCPPLKCNEIRLERAVSEIVKNAFEAAGEKGEVFIQLDYVNENNGRYIIKVKDTGSGMTKENMVKVFDPFYTTKQGVKGAGLGLTIAYAAVLNHNGMINIESQTGRGTEVSIILPKPKDTEEKI